MKQFNYILVVGDQEMETGKVSVRMRDSDSNDAEAMEMHLFLGRLQQEMAEFQ